MKAFLASVSFLLLFFSVPSASQEAENSCIREYQLLMNVRGNNISALCIMEIAQEDNIIGTVVNEMGMKVFDFTLQRGKIKILNVIAPLNKWYIRKKLRKDFLYMIPLLDQEEKFFDKKQVKYTFTPMNLRQ